MSLTKIYVNVSFHLFIFSTSWFYTFHLSNSSHISMISSCSLSKVLSNSSHTSSRHEWLLFLCWFFISLYYSHYYFLKKLLFYSFVLIFNFFSRHIYTFFFLHSFFKFNGVLFDFWVWGGSRDAQKVELFITSRPKFTPEKPAQSKPSPDQIIIRPNRSSKWTEVGWDIQTMGCFGWTIFGPNSTETDRCPPLI